MKSDLKTVQYGTPRNMGGHVSVELSLVRLPLSKSSALAGRFNRPAKICYLENGRKIFRYKTENHQKNVTEAIDVEHFLEK